MILGHYFVRLTEKGRTALPKKFKTEIIAESLQLGPRIQTGGQTATTNQYSKPYQTPTQNQMKAEEIPIIEENAPVNFASEDPKSFTNEEKELIRDAVANLNKPWTIPFPTAPRNDAKSEAIVIRI